MIKLLMIGFFITVLTSAVAGSAYGMIHGNWCGVGHRLGPGGISLPPIDSLDSACMHHDICIASHGIGNCTCDRLLLQELRIVPYHEPYQAIKARAIYDTMSWFPCLGPEAISKPLWFFEQLKEDILYGGPLPIEVFSRLFYTMGNPW